MYAKMELLGFCKGEQMFKVIDNVQFTLFCAVGYAKIMSLFGGGLSAACGARDIWEPIFLLSAKQVTLCVPLDSIQGDSIMKHHAPPDRHGNAGRRVLVPAQNLAQSPLLSSNATRT